jgi:glycosyltransferase involved in cell wall biosynthesis
LNNALLNLSNLHAGGGLQVAISFVDELSRLPLPLFNYTLIVSTQVHEGGIRIGTNVSKFSEYEVLDTVGVSALWSPLNKRIKHYDCVFTLFGPNYLRIQAQHEIVGFAQPWILIFKNPISQAMRVDKRFTLWFKFYIQRLFFKRSHKFVVELEHVKEGLVSQKIALAENISVVHNTLSALYSDSTRWSSVSFVKQANHFAIGFVTRDYPHKNIAILPSVANILFAQYGIQVHFYITLNEQEWQTKSVEFKQSVSTVGALSVDQCPRFYQQMDAIIFPSLLECFSATPLEAMAMKKPLFASDRGFVKDVCAQYAYYFEPTDARSIAKVIADYVSNTASEVQLEAARQHALNFSNATQRAKDYIRIIQDQLTQV